MAPTTPLDLPNPPANADTSTGRLTWIGTATVLLEIGGFTVLTDPNFLHAGERAYIGMGLAVRRQTDPAMELRSISAARGWPGSC